MLDWDPSPREAPTSGQQECEFSILRHWMPARATLQDLLPHDDERRLEKPAGKFAKDGELLFQ